MDALRRPDYLRSDDCKCFTEFVREGERAGGQSGTEGGEHRADSHFAELGRRGTAQQGYHAGHQLLFLRAITLIAIIFNSFFSEMSIILLLLFVSADSARLRHY